MRLIKQYKASITRYNFGEPWQCKSKVFDLAPTVEQLLEFLEEYNKEESLYRFFDTTIEVNSFYQVQREV